MKEFFREKNEWKMINPHIFSVVLNACDTEMLERLKGQKGYNDGETSIVATQDGIALLRMIKSICHRQDEPEVNTMTLVRFDIELMTAAKYAEKMVEKAVTGTICLEAAGTKIAKMLERRTESKRVTAKETTAQNKKEKYARASR